MQISAYISDQLKVEHIVNIFDFPSKKHAEIPANLRYQLTGTEVYIMDNIYVVCISVFRLYLV